MADQFQKKTWMNKLALRKRLYSLKLKEGNSIHKHIKVMTDILEMLPVIGNSIEEDRALHLLNSLPDSYNIWVTTI